MLFRSHLKIVLPKLHEQIDKSEEYCGKIKNKKIYILVPKDCSTFPNIHEADPRVTADGKLEPYEVYRAGTKRVYNYIVHSIQRTAEEEPCYIVLEYATTLMTLYEMSMYTNSGLSSQQRDEQVLFLILLFNFLSNHFSLTRVKTFQHNIIPKRLRTNAHKNRAKSENCSHNSKCTPPSFLSQ